MQLSTNSLLTSMLISTLLLTACGDKAQTKSETATATATATPASDKTDTAVIKALQDNLDKSGITIKVTNAIATQMPDMYWVSFDNAPSMFTDKSGTYLIQGQIVKLGDGEPVDIGADLLSVIAKDALAKVPESEQIIFTAQGDKKPTSMSSPIRPVITVKSYTARSMPSPQAVSKSVTWLGHAPKKMSHLPRLSGVAATARINLLKPNKAKPSTHPTATTLSSSTWHWGIHSVSVARQRSLPHQACKSAATSLLMS